MDSIALPLCDGVFFPGVLIFDLSLGLLAYWFAITLLFVCCFSAICLLFLCYLFAVSLLFVCCFSAICLLFLCYLSAVSLLFVCCFSATCLLFLCYLFAIPLVKRQQNGNKIVSRKSIISKERPSQYATWPIEHLYKALPSKFNALKE